MPRIVLASYHVQLPWLRRVSSSHHHVCSCRDAPLWPRRTHM